MTISKLEEQDTYDWKTAVTSALIQELEKAIFNEKVKEYMLQKRTYKNNKSKVFTVIFGQCPEKMKVTLEGQENWETIKKEKDIVQLLKSKNV